MFTKHLGVAQQRSMIQKKKKEKYIFKKGQTYIATLKDRPQVVCGRNRVLHTGCAENTYNQQKAYIPANPIYLFYLNSSAVQMNYKRT